MKDVSLNTHQTPDSEKNLTQEITTVYYFPKMDIWKVPGTYKLWEISEKALKKYAIIDDL